MILIVRSKLGVVYAAFAVTVRVFVIDDQRSTQNLIVVALSLRALTLQLHSSAELSQGSKLTKDRVYLSQASTLRLLSSSG